MNTPPDASDTPATPDARTPPPGQARLVAGGDAARAAFLARYGDVFEHSRWVAEAAAAGAPFAGPDAVHRAMCAALRAAPRPRQLALLRAHPELWGPEARARAMTADSELEQRSAGLDRLSAEEAERIDALNDAHRQRFGFPFIIAVLHHTRASIFAEFERRLALDPEAEFDACLAEVEKITRLRIARIDEGR